MELEELDRSKKQGLFINKKGDIRLVLLALDVIGKHSNAFSNHFLINARVGESDLKN